MPGLGHRIIERRKADPGDTWAATADPDAYDKVLSDALSDDADPVTRRKARDTIRKRLPEYAKASDLALRNVYHPALAIHGVPPMLARPDEEERAKTSEAMRTGNMIDSMQKHEEKRTVADEHNKFPPEPLLRLDNPGDDMSKNQTMAEVESKPSLVDIMNAPDEAHMRVPNEAQGIKIDTWKDLLDAQKKVPGSKIKLAGTQYQLQDSQGNALAQPESSFFEGNPWHMNPPDQPGAKPEPTGDAVDKALGVFTGSGDVFLQQPAAALARGAIYDPEAKEGQRWLPQRFDDPKNGWKSPLDVIQDPKNEGYGVRAYARGAGGNLGEGTFNNVGNWMNPQHREANGRHGRYEPQDPVISGRDVLAGMSGLSGAVDKAQEGLWGAVGSVAEGARVAKNGMKAALFNDWNANRDQTAVGRFANEMQDVNSKEADKALEDAQAVLLPQDLPSNDEVGRGFGKDVVGETVGDAAQMFGNTAGTLGAKLGWKGAKELAKSPAAMGIKRAVYDATPAWGKQPLWGNLSNNPGILLANESAKPNLMAADQAARNVGEGGALKPIQRSVNEGNPHQIQTLDDFLNRNVPMPPDERQLPLLRPSAVDKPKATAGFSEQSEFNLGDVKNEPPPVGAEIPGPARKTQGPHGRPGWNTMPETPEPTTQMQLPAMTDQRRFVGLKIPTASEPREVQNALKAQGKVLIITGDKHAGNVPFSTTAKGTEAGVLRIPDLDADAAQFLNGKVMDRRSAEAVAYSLSQNIRYQGHQRLARFLDDMLGSTGTARMITAGSPGFFARQRTEELGRVFVATPHAFDKDVKAMVAPVVAGQGEFAGIPAQEIFDRIKAEGTLSQSAIDHLSLTPGDRRTVGPTVPFLRPAANLAREVNAAGMKGWKGKAAELADKTLGGASKAADVAQTALSAPGEALGEVVNSQINQHFFPGLYPSFPSEDSIKVLSVLGKLKEYKGQPGALDRAIQETSEDLINFSKLSGLERASKPIVPFGKYYTSMWNGALGAALHQPQRFRHLYTLSKLAESVDTQAHGGEPINAKWKTRSEAVSGYPMVQVGRSVWHVRPETPLGGVGSQFDMGKNTFAGDNQNGQGFGSLLAPSIQNTANMFTGHDQNGQPAVLNRDVQANLESRPGDYPGGWLPPGLSIPLLAAQYQTDPRNAGKPMNMSPEMLLGNDPWAKAWVSALRANPFTGPYANAPIIREITRFAIEKGGAPPTREKVIDEIISRAFTDALGVRKDIVVPGLQGAAPRRAAEKKMVKPGLELFDEALKRGQISPP